MIHKYEEESQLPSTGLSSGTTQILTEVHLIGRFLAILYRQGMGSLKRVWQYIANANKAV